MTVCSGEALEVGDRFEVPNDEVGCPQVHRRQRQRHEISGAGADRLACRGLRDCQSRRHISGFMRTPGKSFESEFSTRLSLTEWALVPVQSSCLSRHAKRDGGSYRRVGHKMAGRPIDRNFRGGRGSWKGDQAPGAFACEKRLKNGKTAQCTVRVFAHRVLHQSPRWPEYKEREFKWLSAKQAARAVKEPSLSKIILQLSRQREVL
jgi:hypothetical protein